ncbi:MAG: beta-ketoacyl synthase chain length factor [Kofleriaceae bacterium]
MNFEIVATSFFSTDYASAGDALAGVTRPPIQPAYPLLVARARRFTSLVTQMHVQVIGELPIERERPPASVFATVHGEIRTAERLIEEFPLVSGARFALSVHNSPAGVYAVAVGSHAPTTTVTGNHALAGGWLEAVLTVLGGTPVVLSIADEPVGAVFRGPTTTIGGAAAFLLQPVASGRRATLALVDRDRAPTEPDMLHTLAQLVDAIGKPAPSTLVLGSVQAGTELELHLEAR